MSGIRTPEDMMQRCWVDEDTGCWHWRGVLTLNRAPAPWFPALGRHAGFGVMACYFATGAAPKRGQAWHCTCDTRFCANPSHRKCGNRSSQNLAAHVNYGPLRRARISAAMRAKGKLTEVQRAEIAGSDEPAQALADRYGISIALAYKVRRARQVPLGSQASVFGWRP